MLSLTRTLRWVRGRRPDPTRTTDGEVDRVVAHAARYVSDFMKLFESEDTAVAREGGTT